VVKDSSRTVMIDVARANAVDTLERAFASMEKEGRALLRSEGFPDAKQKHERSLSARYQGQSFELQIKHTRGNIVSAFHRAHLARYGYAQETNVVEIVSARLRSIGLVEKAKAKRLGVSISKGFAKPHGFAETYFEGKKVRASVYRRDEIKPGTHLRIPCIVAEYSATTLIPEGAKASADSFGNIMVEVGRP